MKLSETISKVIPLAEAIRDYWDTELPKRHPNYPLVNPGEDDGPPPAEEKKLKNLLMRLPPDGIYKLALIMHLGRGSCRTDNLAAHYRDLKETLGKRQWAVAQLMTPPLADYLGNGLVKLEKAGIDVDHLPLAPVRSST